jgi:predicted flap endonuclease-1-like 5' DNA nuclease
MKEKHSTNFLIGFILGALICVVVWYWQKSTAADEGALDLLDRLAELDRKLRVEETAVSNGSRLAVSPQPTIATPHPDDLQQVKGIGPVFNGRLQAEGITTIAQVAAMSAPNLANLLEISENRAKNILTEAAKTL